LPDGSSAARSPTSWPAKAIAFGEARRPEFATYAQQIDRQQPGGWRTGLLERGVRLVSGRAPTTTSC